MDNGQVAVQHYENFPVASLLCPAALRPAIAAIYHFARTADDLADEGDAAPAQRIGQLAQYRGDLDAALAGRLPVCLLDASADDRLVRLGQALVALGHGRAEAFGHQRDEGAMVGRLVRPRARRGEEPAQKGKVQLR